MSGFVFLAGMAGCAVDEDPAPTRGCAGTSDCAAELVCDQTLGECVDQPVDRVLGGFTCPVFAAQEPDTEDIVDGRSDVLGFLAEETGVLAKLVFVARPNCFFQDDWLYFNAHDLGGFWNRDRFALWVGMRASDAVPGTEVAVQTALVTRHSTFLLGEMEHAESTSGFVRFDDAPTVGALAAGYLDVSAIVRCPDEVCTADMPGSTGDDTGHEE